MILGCENCLTRYLVTSSAIGPAGRTVRCKNCGHEWFQEPEELPPAQASDEPDYMPPLPEEPIPEAVKPIPEGSNLPALTEYEPVSEPKGGVALALFAVLLLSAGSVAGVYFKRDLIVEVWPPAAGLYFMAGLDVPVRGEGLAIDRVQAVVEQDESGMALLVVQGYVINPKDDMQAVPPLEIVLRSGDGKTFDSWKIDPPQGTINANSELAFRATYPQLPETVKEANVSFVLLQ